MFHLGGYRMRGSVEDALETCDCEFLKILSKLLEYFRVRFTSIIDNPVIKSTATSLNTRSYSSMDIQKLLQASANGACDRMR